ncbi:hypothetical protein CH375_20975 [Leptospira ellisii]|nr:hypothetical protein CH375_20975 [Leptospira ellisii]
MLLSLWEFFRSFSWFEEVRSNFKSDFVFFPLYPFPPDFPEVEDGLPEELSWEEDDAVLEFGFPLSYFP